MFRGSVGRCHVLLCCKCVQNDVNSSDACQWCCKLLQARHFADASVALLLGLCAPTALLFQILMLMSLVLSQRLIEL